MMRDPDRYDDGRSGYGLRHEDEAGSQGWRGFFGGRDRDRGPDYDDVRARDRYDREREQGREWREDRDRDERHYRERGGVASGRRDEGRPGLPIDETGRLIASNKVEDTAVYGRDGVRLGTIYNFMVDKYSGQVEYAVMRYGGFLGMGQRYYPLPWRILNYDVRAGGYRIDMTDRDMRHAPSFTREDEPDFSRDYGRRVHDHYGLRY
jgi:sporulation protein YlmC with PRC-barrel domain